jgi:hypothetical protein
VLQEAAFELQKLLFFWLLPQALIVQRQIGSLIFTNFSLRQRTAIYDRCLTKIRMTRVLRFWVEVDLQIVREENSDRSKPQLLSDVLRKFEEAGDATR